MSRLTKLDNDITKVKGTYMPYDERPIITLSNATYIQCLLNKLGKLEDLEEELGCPLEVLVKALKSGIYRMLENGKIIFETSFKLKFYSSGWCLIKPKLNFKLEDYKKTWWLKKDKSE